MTAGRASLWSLAGRVYHEAIFQGQLVAAGSNVARLTERMQRSSSYIAKQGRTIQILGSFYLLIVAFVSVVAFVEVADSPGSAWSALVATGSVSVQLLVQSGYLIMLTILATAEILAPDLYRWLETLPIGRDQLGSLRILALAREFVLPLSVIVVSTPLVAGIAGGSLPAALVGLAVAVEHAAVTLGLAVLGSWRMRRALRASDGEDRSARIARVVTMVVYGVGTLLVVFIMQISSNVLIRLFESPGLDPARSIGVLRVLALLPLPTAPATLLVSVVTGAQAVLLALPIVGTVLYGALALVLLGRVRTLVRRESTGTSTGAATTRRRSAEKASDARSHSDGHVPSAATARRPIVVRSPREAFARQIRGAMTRDTQALVTLLFPLILPLLGTVGPSVSGGPAVIVTNMGIAMAAVAGSWMVVHGLTRLQFGSGGLESTLPTRERDRIVPRLRIAALLPAAGALLPALLLMEPGSGQQFGVLVQSLCVAVVAPAGLLLKVALFGRVRSGSNPFVIDELRTKYRFWKWAAVVSLLVVLGTAIMLGYELAQSAWGGAARAVLPAAALIVAGIEIGLARRMFP